MSGLGLTEMQKENVIKYWDYSFLHGPHKWFLNCKIGERQSPIDIALNETRYDPKLNKSELMIQREAVRFSVHNTGLSVNFTPLVTRRLIIEDGPLNDTYQLGGLYISNPWYHEPKPNGGNRGNFVKGFHLHWGKQDFRGSEHLLEGHSFAAELHLVHWNMSKYKSLDDALTKEKGLCVLGVFLDITKTFGHPALENVIELLPEIQFKGEKFETSHKFDPYSLLPRDTRHYWTYEGSLTTPPCAESVTWIIFKDSLPIHVDQLNKLRRLKAVPFWEEGKSQFDDPMSAQGPLLGTGPPTIGNNYRPVMPIGGRKIRSSFQTMHL